MLDENLPTFYIRAPTSDSPLSNTILLTQNASELSPEYTLRRPDPSLPASKNCYAVALYDSYSPDVLYAEVMVQPEWAQPTLSQAEIRAQNGIPPPPVPLVPNKFTIQLYNPDQQVTIRQVEGKWNSSTYWEFEMPQKTFRRPSTSALDRTSDDPAVSDVTPKIGFKWKKDGKLSKDMSCYLAGKATVEGRKNKEPDIIIAMYKIGRDQSSLTLYEPNLHRVEMEDFKGLEVVLMLSTAVIKDIFFNPSREMFNISSPSTAHNPKRKNSGPVIGGRKLSGTPPLMTGAVLSSSPPRNSIPSSQIPPQQPYRQPQQQQPVVNRPPPTDPRTQWEIDAETARLKAMVEAEEKERDRADRKEQKRIKKMLEEEDRERQRREAEIAKETERLRKQYGVQQLPPPPPNRVQFQSTLPARPHANSIDHPQPQYQLPQYQSAPHSQPPPVQRPLSTSSVTPRPQQQQQQQQQPHASLNSWLGRQDNSPYLQAPAQAGASSSGFFSSLGGGKKVQKKRSVFF